MTFIKLISKEMLAVISCEISIFYLISLRRMSNNSNKTMKEVE